jgi:hypothetical protein
LGHQRQACIDRLSTASSNDLQPITKIFKSCHKSCEREAIEFRRNRGVVQKLIQKSDSTPEMKEAQCKEVCVDASLIAAMSVGQNPGGVLGCSRSQNEKEAVTPSAVRISR